MRKVDKMRAMSQKDYWKVMYYIWLADCYHSDGLDFEIAMEHADEADYFIYNDEFAVISQDGEISTRFIAKNGKIISAEEIPFIFSL